MLLLVIIVTVDVVYSTSYCCCVVGDMVHNVVVAIAEAVCARRIMVSWKNKIQSNLFFVV